MNFFPPNVTANQVTVQIGDSLPFARLFEASDLDGNAITAFRFRDDNATSVSGFFTVNGVVQASNVFFEVDASELSTVRYNAGLVVGTENFSVQVSDGQRLSNVATSQAFTVVANFFPPEITAIPTDVLESETIPLSSIFTVSDPEGNEVVSYFLNDRSANFNGGHLLLNGVRQPSAQFFRITANQLNNVEYVGGQFNQTENVAIQAFDGEFFSDITNVAVTTVANQFRPVTTAFNLNSRLGRVVAAESLFSFSDQDGNSLRSVSFLDTGTSPDSGFFTINGARQTAGSFFTVSADQLGAVRYNVANSSDSEIIRIVTNDGRFDSAQASALVSAIPRPDLGIENRDVVLGALQEVDLVDIVSQIDDGPSLTQYQIIDQNSDGNAFAANLVLNGEILERGIIHTLSPQEFASVQVRGGSADFRSSNEFLIRGRNDLFFTDYEEFRINTEVNFDDALIPGDDTFLASFGPESDNGEKFVVSFTFISGNEPTPTYYEEDSDFRDGATGLGFAQRNAIRDVLEIAESFTDLDFVEVPFTADAADASITFGLTEGLDDDVLGVSIGTTDGPPGLGNQHADIWFNRDFFPEVGSPAGIGSQFFLTGLHEVGHSIGLQHPFAGPVTVPDALDSSVFSVLANNDLNFVDSNGVFQLNLPQTYSLYDINRLQNVYRSNDEFNLTNDQYFFSDTNSLTTLYDAGGRDTINLTNTIAPQTVDLNQGAFSTVNGNFAAISIAYGTVIENARGGGAEDTLLGNSSRNLLFGNGGDDILQGNGGNDVLRGGAGRDTYIWQLGDGRDVIKEERSAGVDSISIIDDTALSSLSDDLVFRRFGQDLRIDLRFNRGQAQGTIIVEDQQFGRSRVETLRLFNTSGDQIGVDIDLDSIFQQATTTAQFFELTSQETNRGFIAVPT